METSENISFLALLMAPDNSPILNQTVSESDCFSALPDLITLDTLAELPPPPQPKSRTRVNNYSLESIIHECRHKIRRSQRQRHAGQKQKIKRGRIRDKLFELSKLMPSGLGRKNTIAELLDAAFKYIKFLQAQVNALETMPPVSRYVQGGGMTRQEMLQVAVNSPQVQMVMAENGWILGSAEQVTNIFNKDQMLVGNLVFYHYKNALL